MPQPIPIGPKTICCFPNQIFSNCTNSCLEKTCYNLVTYGTKPRPCYFLCLSNCICKEGLYKDGNNQCVTAKECYKQLKSMKEVKCDGRHMELEGCLYPPERRLCKRLLMENYSGPISKPAPSYYCAINQCNCKEGYYMHANGVCVRPHECKKKLKNRKKDKCPNPNEYRKKKFIKCHENTCIKRKRLCTKEDIKPVKYGCACKEGFCRDDCDHCVEERKFNADVPCLCSDPCNSSANETYTYFNECNGKKCPVAKWQKSKKVKCSKVNRYACDCKKGYARNENGQCVSLEDCPPKRKRPKKKAEKQPKSEPELVSNDE